NRNDGQGTASVATEFLNSYLELMWPDPTVSVAPGAERGVEKFKNRMNWRTTGWSPIGIALHRVGPRTPFPLPTGTIAPDWMPKWHSAPGWMPQGTALEILTARDDTKSPSFFIEPAELAVKATVKANSNDSSKASDHPLGVERVTEIRLIRPKEYRPVDVFKY